MQTRAIIAKDSPHAARWREVFGCEAIPLLSPVPQRGLVLGLESARFYKLDVAALDDDQRRRLVAYLVGRFRLGEAEVQASLEGEHGLPILADDLVVVMSPRLIFAAPVTAALPALQETA
jgi:hypothetical protein